MKGNIPLREQGVAERLHESDAVGQAPMDGWMGYHHRHWGRLVYALLFFVFALFFLMKCIALAFLHSLFYS